MNDNIKYLKTESGLLQKATGDTIDKEKDYENDYENKCMDFATDYLNVPFYIKKNAQTFADKLLAYSKNKCNEVERRMNVVDQNIKKKTEEEMK